MTKSITTTHSACQKCNSSDFVVVPCPEVIVHSCKRVCAHCHAFQSWAPSPKTLENQVIRQNQIDVALSNRSLTDFQRKFLMSIYNQRHLTPKQNDLFQKIIAKL